MVTTIGSSSAKIRLGDNATGGQGTYEWYFDGIVTDQWTFSNIKTFGAAGITLVTTNYSVQMVTTITDIAESYTDWGNIKKAIRYWQANSSPIYLTVKGDGTNDCMTIPDASYSLQARTVKVEQLRMTPDTIAAVMILLKLIGAEY